MEAENKRGAIQMSKNILDTARDFFEACETGKGWSRCKNFCQADAMIGIVSIAAYAEWMKRVFEGMEDGR